MSMTLHERLTTVLHSDPLLAAPTWPPLADAAPVSRQDRFLTLLEIYDLTTAPLERVGDRAAWAGHPAVAALKMGLEQQWLAELEAADSRGDAADPVAAIRKIAAKDRLPRVYRWVSEQASLAELRHFLAVEGGPDAGFDDLVALCQIGLSGAPKMELARNYWDEMGAGRPAGVHTELHREMAAVVGIPDLPRTELPEAALERAALGGLLATNRWLQPEMIGALGLTELQAGPRCRMVLSGLQRLQVPERAHAFYAEHAEVDPRHGKDSLEQAVAPLAAQHPDWSPRMVRGARWRWQVNAGLFDSLEIDREMLPAA
jgi:hypothetical protein